MFFSVSENWDAGKKNMGFNSTVNEPNEIWSWNSTDLEIDKTKRIS